MLVVYSRFFGGWVVCEMRQIGNRVERVPISVPHKTEDEAIQAMHTVYEMRAKLRLL